ncbi:hypothetical protein CHUAL_003774 [Chamberlinius hualienensis]
MMAGSLQLKSVTNLSPIFEKVLSIFPSKIEFAFAYGSGVFKQGDKLLPNDSMIDLVFAVEDPLQFHRLNVKKNHGHYSFLKYGGPELIDRVQQKLGAKVYYNTLIPFENRLIKYGVISTSALITDLLDWDSLYLSGRLHKPVLVLKKPSQPTIDSALTMNLNNALHTAFLLLPENFTEAELYLKITGLSYGGDFRMWAGEDKNKVNNIVKGNFEQFQELYHAHIKKLSHIHWKEESGTIEQDWNPQSRLHHLNLLPKTVQINLYNFWNRDGRQRDLEDVLKVIANDIYCDTFVQDAVERIVWKSSWTQSLKGILTAVN